MTPTRPAHEPVRDRADVRLAIGTAVAWLVLSLCLQSSFRVALTVGVAGVLVGVGALTLKGRALAGAVAAGGFCVAIVLLPFAARDWQARASPLVQLAHRHAAVTIVATTTGDPRALAATGVAGSPRVAVPAEVDEVTGDGRRFAVSGQVLVLAPAAPWRDVLPGQQVRLDGDLQPSLDGDAAGVTLFAEKAPQLVGGPPWWQSTAGAVRASLRRSAAVLPPDERGLLPGLVDGDTSGLDPVLMERFRVAGLTHLVAVSGLKCQETVTSDPQLDLSVRVFNPLTHPALVRSRSGHASQAAPKTAGPARRESSCVHSPP